MKRKDSLEVKQEKNMDAGVYLVGTPIGNARDITLRALDVLQFVDRIYAEDTRVTRQLFDIIGVSLNGRPLYASHDHNENRIATDIVAAVENGEAVALVSDAGMPLISDPGYAIVQAVIEANLPITTIPGPSAVLSAVALSGLATDRFAFLGFLPNKAGKRQSALKDDDKISMTRIYFESPHRIRATLQDIQTVHGNARDVVIARELTKKFETIIRGSVGDLIKGIDELGPLKGEMVVLIAAGEADSNEIDLDTFLRESLSAMSLRDAVAVVTEKTGLKRKMVYQRALELDQS